MLSLDEVIEADHAIRTDSGYVISCWLCEKCFWADYKRMGIKNGIGFSIAVFAVDLLFLFLVTSSKGWPSAMHKAVIGWGGLILINGLFGIAWLVGIRRYKHRSPMPSEKAAVFIPYHRAKLSALSALAAEQEKEMFALVAESYLLFGREEAKRLLSTVPVTELKQLIESKKQELSGGQDKV